ncbi:DUF6349 family protein [Nonomuraea sp. NPDC005650]|uniref:DUF6349 family protein n=1 Tax=Nonomuraea sp. NPDC005650 TaxID=3157045 RepID=UPI0033A71B75
MTEIAPQVDENCRAQVRSCLTANLPPDTDPDPPTVDQPGNRGRIWGYCPGCGHEGPLRSDENLAAEDAADHAYPGWRDMPVVRARPYDPSGKNGPLVTEWETACRLAYPRGWFERKGPVREERYGRGLRHVYGQGPGGGYAMAVWWPGNPPGALFDAYTGVPLRLLRDEAAQESLFE